MKRAFRLFKINSNKLLKQMEDSIEVLEYELKKSGENIDKLSDKISKMKAQRQTFIDQKNKSEEYIVKLQSALDLAVQKDDAVLGNEAIELMDKNKEKIKTIELNIKYYDDVIQKLEDQYLSLKAKHKEKVSKLDSLKTKNEFVKTMQMVNKELKLNYSDNEFDMSEIEKIEQEIQEKIYYETDINEKLNKKDTVEDMVKKYTYVDKFEEYKNSLKGN